MTKKTTKEIIHLETISEEDLLFTKVSDLPLKLQGTWLEECVNELYKELSETGIVFKPQCYLADEWLTPQKETCIGIPFYLAHPTLIRLEKKFMIEAEGETKAWCMKLLRHEAGHALMYAYKLDKRKRWERIFGSSNTHYADNYKYRPYSKNYVRHLDGYYAQYHPEEDFVETFAVWLTPKMNWEEKYKGWKALDKLKYVDKLMKEIQGKEPPVKSSEKFWRLSTLRFNLKTYYKRKRHFWAEEFPDFHDAYLKRNFVEINEENKKNQKVIEIIRKYRRHVVNTVARYSGEKKHVINDLLKDIHKRSKELRLVTSDDEAMIAMHLTSYVTTLIMNYLYTGQFRGDDNKRKKK